MPRPVFLAILALVACRTTPPIKPAPVIQQSVPPPSSFADWLKAQRDAVEKEPQNPKELKRLAAMLWAEGQPADLQKALAALPAEAFSDNGATPALKDFLAQKFPAAVPPKQVKIARAVLCRKISGFRRYVPYGDPKFKPGATALLYVEFDGFALVPWGDYQTLHLRYEWELYDESNRKLSLPAWEKAPPEEKEDKIEFRGPVADFHQSFGLPLPKNIAGGAYAIRITVEDQSNKKRDEIRIPIEIVFE